MQLNHFLSSIKNHCLNFIYPPCCHHCDSYEWIQGDQLLCEPCAQLLDLLDPYSRCPYCFGKDYSRQKQQCGRCKQWERFIDKEASVFEYQGPAGTLVKKLKYGNTFYLAESMGAFMAAQWARLNWPLPDLIVPVPIRWPYRLTRGYNQSYLMGKALGDFLQVPCKEVLKRSASNLSQAGLSYRERKALQASSFRLKSKQNITDKKILLVDDVKTTGSTLRACAEVLQEAYPGSVYAMSFCLTE